MSYVPHTDADRRKMLEAVGVERLEDLVDSIPAAARFPDLDLPQALSELDVERELRELASANVDCGVTAVFSRGGRIPPLRSGHGGCRSATRGALQRLHALPARAQSGHAAGDLRVSEHVVCAHSDGL